MFGRIRKNLEELFADPCAGMAIADNAELVFVPVPPIQEEERPATPPVAEFPRVTQRIVARRKSARRVRQAGTALLGTAVGLALLLSGSESMGVLIGLILISLGLVLIGRALRRHSRRMW